MELLKIRDMVGPVAGKRAAPPSLSPALASCEKRPEPDFGARWSFAGAKAHDHFATFAARLNSVPCYRALRYGAKTEIFRRLSKRWPGCSSGVIRPRSVVIRLWIDHRLAGIGRHRGSAVGPKSGRESRTCCPAIYNDVYASVVFPCAWRVLTL